MSPSLSANAPLSETIAIFENVFAAMAAPVAVFAGPDHRQIYTNPAQDHVFGPVAAPAPHAECIQSAFDQVYSTGVAFDLTCPPSGPMEQFSVIA